MREDRLMARAEGGQTSTKDAGKGHSDTYLLYKLIEKRD